MILSTLSTICAVTFGMLMLVHYIQTLGLINVKGNPCF